jgi:hypothetical protein
VFYDFFPVLVNTFEAIGQGCSQGWNTDSSRQAEGFLGAITRFDFLMAFIIAKIGMSYTKGLTFSLQKQARDICNAYHEVTTVLDTLKAVREDIDNKHKEWFAMTAALSQKINGSDHQLPRGCSRQTARSNIPGDDPEVFFQRSITIPFFDTLVLLLWYTTKGYMWHDYCTLSVEG